ncbi:MAG: hypothetical protein SFU21_12905 [Flavihumibacter sp.]|nr:hypothetical protein [Flavihumibacter sp.]
MILALIEWYYYAFGIAALLVVILVAYAVWCFFNAKREMKKVKNRGY